MRHINRPLQFSRIELRDLVKAWAATSLAFGIFFMRASDMGGATAFVVLFCIAALSAGVAFIIHELSHKLMAHRFHVHGEFRSHDQMLVVSVVLAFLGVIIAAPGAVYMAAQVSKRESGLIALAGPASNLVLGALLLPFAGMAGLLGIVIGQALLINAILAAFNMIPLGGFDGATVLRWHKGWYACVVVLSVVLVVAAYAL